MCAEPLIDGARIQTTCLMGLCKSLRVSATLFHHNVAASQKVLSDFRPQDRVVHVMPWVHSIQRIGQPGRGIYDHCSNFSACVAVGMNIPGNPGDQVDNRTPCVASITAQHGIRKKQPPSQSRRIADDTTIIKTQQRDLSFQGLLARSGDLGLPKEVIDYSS